MTTPGGRPPLTEAEYAAWARARTREIAGVLTTRYAAILPDGVRFEWAGDDDREDGQP